MKYPSNPGPSSLSRRSVLFSGGALALLAAAGCTPGSGGGGGGSSASGDGVRLRYAYWGSPDRQQNFADFVDMFNAETAGISVEIEPSEYAAYFDRLAVQAASRNLPDLYWIPTSQMATYASEGSMFDLGTLPEGAIDFSDFDPAEVESWKLLGKQYAPARHVITPTIQVNRGKFDELGIELPDDNTWDWDDLKAVALEFSQASEEGVYGIRYGAGFQMHIEQWLRQQGAEVIDADGNVGFDADTVGGWFAMWEDFEAAGAALPAEISGTQTTPYTEISHQIGMEVGQTNAMFDAQKVTDGELEVRLMPANRDAAPGFGFLWNNVICVAANTEHPEEAAKFVSFNLNDERTLETIGLNEGAPTNPRLRELARQKADAEGDDIALKLLDITEREAQRERRQRNPLPAGASGWVALLARTTEDISVGNVPIAEACEAMVTELQRSIDQA
jgi:multiple sugar transport system substrate-binding protein